MFSWLTDVVVSLFLTRPPSTQALETHSTSPPECASRKQLNRQFGSWDFVLGAATQSLFSHLSLPSVNCKNYTTFIIQELGVKVSVRT